MIFLKIFEPLGSDFTVYYEAAKMFLMGLNPYRGLFTREFPYNYPPSSLLFIWPIALFGQPIANVLWNIASTLAVVLSVWLLVRIGFKSPSWKLILFLSFLFTIPFFPVKFNIGNGQINHFLLLLSVSSLYFYNMNKKNLSALLLACAVAIKIAPIIFVFYWLIKQDWRQIAYFGTFLGGIVLLSFFFIPLSYQLDYFLKVLPLSFTLGAKDWYYNQSLEGFLARSFTTPGIILITTYLASFAIVLVTWIKGLRLNNLRLISAVSSLYLIIHPIALQHYFGFAIIPFILLGVDLRKTKSPRGVWSVLILAYILIALDIKNFNSIPPEFKFILSHDFYGILMLWILALWKEHLATALALIWIIGLSVGYLVIMLCRGGICL